MEKKATIGDWIMAVTVLLAALFIIFGGSDGWFYGLHILLIGTAPVAIASLLTKDSESHHEKTLIT